MTTTTGSMGIAELHSTGTSPVLFWGINKRGSEKKRKSRDGNTIFDEA